ncbi:MAG: response regulator, partial [Hyphomonadaceae bacterium]
MSAPVLDALTRPPHILIVDDDDRIRELLQRYLANGGARVSSAADAASARKLLASFEFDLLILDVMMPQEDGFSLAESVRRTSSVPIILLTARGLAEDRIKGLSLGADDYV